MLPHSFRYLVLSLVSFAFLLGMAGTVSACSCAQRPTVMDAFEASDEVVILRAVSVEKAANTENEHYVDGVRSTTMVVEKVFKGKLKVRDEIVLGQGNGADCIWTFSEKSVGNQYLFYLHRPEKRTNEDYLPPHDPGTWFAFGCGRSRGLAVATEDLLYLEKMQKVRGKTRISGTIGGWQNPDIAVDGKRIKIIGSKKTYWAKTDENGVFEIYDLPPGKYFVEPETPEGWRIDPYWFRYSPSVVMRGYDEPEMKSPRQVAITLEEKKHASLEIIFEIENFVRGRVLGPKGRPMERVCVYLLRPGAEWGPSDCTDKSGRFEITSINPGDYVLVANRDGKPSDREPFAQIFYPSVSERERAVVINISAGETLENLDIVIPKLVETIIIKGVMRYSDGNPVAEEWVKFKVTKKDEKVDGDVSEQTDSTGQFTLRVLKGLTGQLAGEDWVMKSLFKNCPKVDELVDKSGQRSVTVHTNVIELTTEHNLYDVELTLPFPRCEKAKE
ncbi:MAG TPA: hypothetical protein VJR02_13470 [Pyrinomonadaceae bacterium]|nr:hypothetical protein [Pyrinomonadaceae bacterium]